MTPDEVLEARCRRCGAVGWLNQPPAGWEEEFRRHLTHRCPECLRVGPRTRKLRLVPFGTLPADAQACLRSEVAEPWASDA